MPLQFSVKNVTRIITGKLTTKFLVALHKYMIGKLSFFSIRHALYKYRLVVYS